MADKGKFSQWNHLVGNRKTAVKDLWDPTSALPSDPAVGDRYIATATGTGWTENYIYEWSGAAWTQTAPAENDQVRVENKSAEYLYTGGAWTVISIATKTGRNAYLANTPEERAAEWRGDEPRRHTTRKGRAAWAQPRYEAPSSSAVAVASSSLVSSSELAAASSSLVSSSVLSSESSLSSSSVAP